MEFLLTLTTSTSNNSVATTLAIKYFIEMIQPIMIFIMIFVIMCILKNAEEEIKTTNKKLDKIINNTQKQ